ncbi:MAG TPA: response regulator [Polyangiaceae bacterium]|jgi:FixJ family two-component response regulator
MSRPTRQVVAVVDDDPRILESLEDLLESAGYEVRLHSSGGSLLASDIADIDCVITDIGMPGMDGFEVRDRLKQRRSELQVFLISGRRDPSDEQAEDLAGTEFFRKPFDGPALLAAIARALTRGGS